MIFQGYFTRGYKPGDTPDLRVIAVMAGFSGEAEPEAVNIADLAALDEFDGVGYVRYDCTGVSVAYDSGSHEMRIDFDSGNLDEFGDPVVAGSGNTYGYVLYEHVDGTAANDVLIAFTTEGAGINANGGKFGLTIPVGGWLYEGEA